LDDRNARSASSIFFLSSSAFCALLAAALVGLAVEPVVEALVVVTAVVVEVEEEETCEVLDAVVTEGDEGDLEGAGPEEATLTAEAEGEMTFPVVETEVVDEDGEGTVSILCEDVA